uniref:C-type lectin domain-containing protein n=1 Tax=Stomoxys calcitrans TaxID=35570 RepID=A0A1I8PWG6_STOCA
MKGAFCWSLLILATLFGASGGNYYNSDDGSLVYIGSFYGIHLSVTWFDAVCACYNRGLVPITIDSEHKENQIKRLLTKIGANETFWTGGNNIANANYFKWLSSGNVIEYSNWGYNAPSYASDNCINIDSTNKWDHWRCDIESRYMCEENAYIAQSNAEPNEDPLFYVHEQLKDECKLNRKDDLQHRFKITI